MGPNLRTHPLTDDIEGRPVHHSTFEPSFQEWPIVTTDEAAGRNPTAPPYRRLTGSYRFWFADQRWEWSDQVAALHGYRPGQARPTTELLLAHKHPDDRAEVADTLATVVRTGLPFSSRHRIIDTAGITRHVLVVGDQLRDDAGEVVGTAGFYIDVTDSVHDQRRETIDEILPDLVAAREVIEQAKGALMAIYGINAEQAFDVLIWRSQETNTKLRALAEGLVSALHDFHGAEVHTRARFDHLLLTVHEHTETHTPHSQRTHRHDGQRRRQSIDRQHR